MEFWNDVTVDKSWKVLIRLTKEFDVTVIGGWAAYLLTKALKSKDVDIIVDFDTLDQLGMNYLLKKNMHLKKYEIIVDEISVDIYVPYFSKLIIPVEELKKYSMIEEGIKVVMPEALLILKQQAESEREDSVKGQKDRVDILNILMNANVDFKKYFDLIKKYNLNDYPKRMKSIVQNAKKEFEYLGISNPREIKLIKKRIIGKL
jgi:radical SAM superfamily enzyme with C-terminal helix-hairpin-helix motif